MTGTELAVYIMVNGYSDKNPFYYNEETRKYDLFYTPDEKSFDETDMAKIEAILEEEVNKFLINVKNKLRTINQI